MKPIAAIFATLTCSIICTVSSFAGDSSFDFEKLKGRPNLDQTPLGTSGRWTLEKLLALTQKEGVELWRTLPAASLKEMSGHYMGIVPAADNAEQQGTHAKAFFNKDGPVGYWLGKAYRPVSESGGEGYNRFRQPAGKISRIARFESHIGPSVLDSKPAFIGSYGAGAVDELRKLEDSIYLGVALSDLGNGKHSEPLFFVLIGPTDAWVGPDKN